MQIAGCSIEEGSPRIPRLAIRAHTVLFRIYFARAWNDELGAEGVTRTIRETIGNCTIVHREMIVEFRESTGARSDKSRFSRKSIIVRAQPVIAGHVKKLHTFLFSSSWTELLKVSSRLLRTCTRFKPRELRRFQDFTKFQGERKTFVNFY